MAASLDRVLVAGHPRTSVEELQQLARSREVDVRVAVADRPFLPALAALAGDTSVEVRAAIASQEATPDEVLRVLAGDVDMDVRSRVHAKPSASQETKVVAALLGVR